MSNNRSMVDFLRKTLVWGGWPHSALIEVFSSATGYWWLNHRNRVVNSMAMRTSFARKETRGYEGLRKLARTA